MNNNFVFKLIVLASLFYLVPVTNQVQAAELKKAHNIVFQVIDDNPMRWMQVLGISNNVQKLLGKDKVEIEIVVHSGGIHMLTSGSAVANKITQAEKAGIVFAACAQTMKRDNFTANDLVSGVKIVPIGSVEIMQKQEAGWSYIRL